MYKYSSSTPTLFHYQYTTSTTPHHTSQYNPLHITLIMSTHPLCSFSLADLTSMVKQMFDYTKRGDITVSFWTVNSHIPQHRRRDIERAILGPLVDRSLSFNNWRPRWPIDFPIFSPYATTKDNTTSQYSQGEPIPTILTLTSLTCGVRWSGDGHKYYCHLVAYAHQHGPMSFGTDQEISHTRFCGKRTSRYVNSQLCAMFPLIISATSTPITPLRRPESTTRLDTIAFCTSTPFFFASTALKSTTMIFAAESLHSKSKQPKPNSITR